MIDTPLIEDTFTKMKTHLTNHDSICVSISGGSDSDIILHIIATYFREFLPKTHFVFSNTGIEYAATKRHLDYLENHYNVEIVRLSVKDGVQPVPVVVKKYGVPFVSKQVSEFLGRLQTHNFDFSDRELQELEELFPKTRAALRWWCNDWGDKSRFNIDWNIHLKEFLMENHPTFHTSSMCCQKSKKEPLMKYQKSVNCDLVVTGERKSEGGQRARKSSCFEISHDFDHFMPLFFWDDATKKAFEESEGIVHSDCYTVYGLKRTGCVGCPFARGRKEELKIMLKYEPNLYRACQNVFGEAYEFTDKFEEFKKNIKEDRNEHF